MTWIALNQAELELAAYVGSRRHIEALAKGLPDKHGFDQEPWQVHIEGACGELAFCKATGRYWDGSVNRFRDGADVGTNFQVKTRSRLHYELIIRPHDDPAQYYVLVVGTAPKYRVVGYILGSDGMQDTYLQTYGGRPKAYFVPQDHLIPLPTTKE